MKLQDSSRVRRSQLIRIGVIMAALGMETTSGDFEVIDLCFAGLPDLLEPTAGPSGLNGSVHGNGNRNGNGKGKAKEEDLSAESRWFSMLLLFRI